MLGRALSLATASLICCLATTAGWAQNLDAGKSPAQIFNGSCAACHKSARGLLKTVPPSSLSGFLRQHYTTGSDMAQMLAGYLVANGASAADSRTGGKRGRAEAGSNLRSDAPIGTASEAERGREQAQRPDRRPAARPTIEEGGLGGLGALFGRRQPDAAGSPDGAPAAGASGEPPSGPKARQKLTKKNRKGEPPKTETKVEPSTEGPSAGVVSKPEVKPDAAAAERAIDARVPMPEPVDLPPPTAADIKPEKPEPAAAEKAETAKPNSDKAAAEAPASPVSR